MDCRPDRRAVCGADCCDRHGHCVFHRSFSARAPRPISREKAALRYASVLLLPIVVVLVIWAAGEFSSYFAAPEDFRWDAEASWSFLVSLLPLGLYVGVPTALLVIVFWLAVRFSRPTSATYREMML